MLTLAQSVSQYSSYPDPSDKLSPYWIPVRIEVVETNRELKLGLVSHQRIYYRTRIKAHIIVSNLTERTRLSIGKY